MVYRCYHCHRVKVNSFEDILRHSLDIHSDKEFCVLKPTDVNGRRKYKAVHYRTRPKLGIQEDSVTVIGDITCDIVSSREPSPVTAPTTRSPLNDYIKRQDTIRKRVKPDVIRKREEEHVSGDISNGDTSNHTPDKMRSNSANGISTGAFSRRIAPGYKGNVAMVLGVAEVAIGAIILIVACVAFGLQVFSKVGGCALLSGISTIVCGGFSLLSAIHNEMLVISATAVVGALSVIFSLSLLVSSSLGISKEAERWSHHSQSSRESLDVVALVMSLLALCSVVCTLVLCWMVLFYGCFHKLRGAKYVSRTNMPSESSGGPGMEADNYQAATVAKSGPQLSPGSMPVQATPAQIAVLHVS